MGVRMCMAMGVTMSVVVVMGVCAGRGLAGHMWNVAVVHATIGNLQVTSRSSMAEHHPRHRIGDAARLSGVSAANIRYYEKEGLLAPGVRGGNSYRFYSESDLHRLRFIRLCRAMDMSLDEVRTLLALDMAAGGTDHAACATLDEHLQHVRTRLAELATLEQELLALRARCDGTGGQCHVIEALHERADTEPVPALAPLARRHV